MINVKLLLALTALASTAIVENSFASKNPAFDATKPGIPGLDWSKVVYKHWQNQPVVSFPKPDPRAYVNIKAPRPGLELRFAEDFTKPGKFINSLVSPKNINGVWSSDGNGFTDTLVNRYIASQKGEHIYVDRNFLKRHGIFHRDLDPLVIRNGHLVIRAIKIPANVQKILKDKFTRPTDAALLKGRDKFSGSISTKNSFHFKYGYVEVRVKLPQDGPGLWPAIWMLRADKGGAYGEIDINEFISTKPKNLHSGILFTPDYNSYRLNFVKNPLARDNPAIPVNRKLMNFNLNDDYRIFGLEWNENEIITYMDGQEIGRAKTPNALKAPMYLILNMAVGGSWAGPTHATRTTFPAEFKVDYVRVWQKPDAPTFKAPRPDAFFNNKWEDYSDYAKRFKLDY